MASDKQTNLCPICWSINIKPQTFLQTGWRYPTSLQYESTTDWLVRSESSAPALRPNYYVPGEQILDELLPGIEDSNEHLAPLAHPFERTSALLFNDNILDEKLPAPPQKHLFDDQGNPRWTVPYKYRRLGSLGQIRKRADHGCCLCQLIVTAFEEWSTPEKTHHSRCNTSDYNDLECKIQFDFKDIADLSTQEDSDPTRTDLSLECRTAQLNGTYQCTIDFGSEYSAHLYPMFSGPNDEFSWFGGSLIGETIDYKLVQQWLTDCESTHLICSEEQGKIDVTSAQSLRVIDVLENCLVEIDTTESRYVALSYVWGDCPTLKVTKRGLQALRETGALQARRDEIPKTTLDAMHVVRCLGFRYLWTDSLCIIQDDEQEVLPELRRMDIIYAAAHLTIVAADGSDVGKGLPGSSSARLREASSYCKYSNGLKLVLVSEKLPETMLRCPWSTRLWTLQEAWMSRRLLIFAAHGLHYNCSKLTWSEASQNLSEAQGALLRHEEENYFKFRSEITRDDAPDVDVSGSMWQMEEWITFVMEASERRLMYEWDIENATAGLVFQLEMFYKTNSLSGLPEVKLLEFLLWSPMRSGSLQRRRQRPGYRSFASWSWIGWVGEIVWPEGDATDIDTDEQQHSIELFKLRDLHAQPVALNLGTSVGTRASRPSYPLLLISSHTIHLQIMIKAKVPTNIKELQPYTWYVVHKDKEGKQERIGVFGLTTNVQGDASLDFDARTDMVGSVTFDCAEMLPQENDFECDFILLYPKPRQLDIGDFAGQWFHEVLAIKRLTTITRDNGEGHQIDTSVAERIGHGRLLVQETHGMWKAESIILQ